jgi:hypothetical protein
MLGYKLITDLVWRGVPLTCQGKTPDKFVDDKGQARNIFLYSELKLSYDQVVSDLLHALYHFI